MLVRKCLVLVLLLRFSSLSSGVLQSDQGCFKCKMFVALAHDQLFQDNRLQKAVISLMPWGCDLMGFDRSNCDGEVELASIFVKSMMLRFRNNSFTCWLLNYCPDEPFERIDIDHEVERILAEKPRLSLPEVKSEGERLRVLHVTDIHFDSKYIEGSPVACEDMLCCRIMDTAEDKIPADAQRAGEYGGLGRCDIPFKTVVHFFDHVLNPLKIEEWPHVILWTGDNPAHNMWELTREEINNNLIAITDLIKERYEHQVQIIPVWGNHGVAPNDQFSMDDKELAAILGEIADTWKEFLDDEAYQLFKKKGFYSIKLREEFGINGRFIVFNSLLHDTFNFFLFQDQTDPLGQFSFLEDQLKQAEEAGELVYIAGHIPMGTSYSLEPWNALYSALIERYTNIIRGQFFGHEHDDQLKLTQSKKNPGQQSGIQFIAPSLTTYSFLNPSYRVYEVDRTSGFVYDYIQYRMYLTKKQSAWEKAYSMREFYKVKDGSDYAGFQRFLNKMRDDPANYKKAMMMNRCEGPEIIELFESGEEWLYQRFFYCYFGSSVFEEVVQCAKGYPWQPAFYNYYFIQTLFFRVPWYKQLAI